MSSSSGEHSKDDTLPDDPPREAGGPRPRLSLPGYEVSSTIGVGGMGEVLLARDARIGRDVAIKRVRSESPSPELIERFLREAKIQARLDHPAIVPVYELGSDSAGRPYFTMKRLAGKTLAEHLAAESGSHQATLRAFVDVCQAIKFAHARGVVHRDLKPANVMLGFYGEVYVLDWGVARVITREPSLTPTVGTPSLPPEIQWTQVGALLGTPGYMAPEQARGEDVGVAADVYSLGCIMFEILAGEPLHPRGDALASTHARTTQSPALRRPDRTIAPELDAACIAALADDPADRPTSGELAEQIQRYLDGDRDQERRMKLSAELVEAARPLTKTVDGRAEAMRLAGRAIALDPDSQDAAALVMNMMLIPPAQLPATLARSLSARDTASTVHSAQQARHLMLLSPLWIPVALWAGVTSWPSWLAIYTVIGLLAVDATWQARTRKLNLAIPTALAVILLVLFSRLLGPMVITPTLTALVVVGLGSQPRLLDRPWLVLGAGLAAWMVPMGLELSGVFSSTWGFERDHLVAGSRLVHLSGASGVTLLIVSNLVIVTAMFVFVRNLMLSRRRALHQLEIQAWHLQQLLPAPPPSGVLQAIIGADGLAP